MKAKDIGRAGNTFWLLSDLRNQFRNRLSMINDGSRAAVEVIDQRLFRVDAEVMVDRGQEVTWSAASFHDIFTSFVGGADVAPRFDSAAGPKIREGARPVVAAGLDRARRSTRVTGARAGGITDLGRAPEFPGNA